MGRAFDQLGVFLGLARYRNQGVGERIQGLAAFGLGRLDHERAGNYEREINCRRVKPVVEQALGNVESMDAVFLLRAIGKNTLVNARLGIRQMEMSLEFFSEIVGVQQGHSTY